ncbi:hypothetical protein ABZ249_14935 [Nocardiopsis sp. NPDC006139]|uniref:hypothetical protein n=1 Tax=Nocardiopsis sp. NPDC006139 TaxID=3154578 RepID=UPI00339EAFA9
MIPRPCGETSLNSGGFRRTCVLDSDHAGDHEDLDGRTWQPPGTVLARLRAAWGDTHRIAWTGSLWVAVHRDPAASWRTHVEPTPAQLEDRLRRHEAPRAESRPRR